MKRTIIFVFAMLLMFCPAALAKNVTVTGTGMSAAEAERDAMRAAVESALGVLVDSSTLVQNAAVIRDQIYTQSRGFITNYTVTDRSQYVGNEWRVTINATVDDSPDSKLMSELTRLGIIDLQLRNPRIAVYIPETHITRAIPDPAGETALVKALIEAGFSNVTEVGTRINYPHPLSMSAAQMTEAAQKFGADIMIVGEAFSEDIEDTSRFLPGRNKTTQRQNCRARLEAKMFILKTGQIIASDGTYGTGRDSSGAIAAKKALAVAGKRMGEYFVSQITGLYTNRQEVEVVVYGSDFSKINLVQSALEKVRGVKGVRLSNYSGGKAVFAVMYGGSPQNLFNEMQGMTTANFDLREISYNTITVRVH